MLQEIQRTITRLWQQLTWGQRATIVGVSGASVVAIYLLISWANAPTYSLLFSGLSSQDAGSIVTQLQADKVPYQLSDGGSTIMVPQSMVDSERLKLATQGLPQDGVVGFSLFDKTSIFQGDSFTEQVNYTRALEGELTQTIAQLQGVLYDRVNIVLPQQELFSSQQASPTASVLLKLSPAASLSSDQIAGVQHLVASAVQGLKPTDVTVVDGNGTILSNNPDGGDLTAMGTNGLQVEQRYAATLEAQLTAMLDSVLGPDHAVVRVQDVMDWTEKDSTANQYQPQTPNSPISSSHEQDSQVLGPGNSAGGVVGLGSNVPTYGSAISGTTALSQTQHVADITYTNSMTTTHVLAAPGTLSHLSVAVLLNNVTDQARVNTLKQAIMDAAGIDLARGDQFSIGTLPFDNSSAIDAARAAAAQQQQNLILNIARWAALIIVPLVLLFLLRRLLVPSPPPPTDEDIYDFPDEVGLNQAPATPAGLDTMAVPGGARSIMRASLAELAREKPQAVAGVIGRWMDEDRT